MENMASSERTNQPNLSQKFNQLRSAINSSSVDDVSILADASRYIRELMERIEKLNRDIRKLKESHEVKVETLENGLRIHVVSEKHTQSMFVVILQVFDELGLEIVDASARVSRSPSFSFEALIQNEKNADAGVIEEAVIQAIRKLEDQQS